MKSLHSLSFLAFLAEFEAECEPVLVKEYIKLTCSKSQLRTMFNKENQPAKIIKNYYLSFLYFFILNLSVVVIKVLKPNFERNVNTLALTQQVQVLL